MAEMQKQQADRARAREKIQECGVKGIARAHTSRLAVRQVADRLRPGQHRKITLHSVGAVHTVLSMQVITNNAPRPVIYDYELTLSEQREFDYIDWQACAEGRDSASFFRYRGQLYDLSEFIESAPLDVQGWDAFRSDSFFSGLVIRYVQADDGDQVVVGLLVA